MHLILPSWRSKRQPGGSARPVAAKGAASSRKDVGGGSEQVTLATLHKLVTEQTRIMKVVVN